MAAEPAHWQMHLLQLDEMEGGPLYAHTAFVDDHPIGVVTSGGYGHRVKKPLALAYFREAPAIQDCQYLSSTSAWQPVFSINPRMIPLTGTCVGDFVKWPASTASRRLSIPVCNCRAVTRQCVAGLLQY